MVDINKMFCDVSIYTYQYFYKIAKEEYECDGEDTKESAFDYTYRTLAGTGFVFVNLEENVINAYAIDPAPFLAVNVKTLKTELLNYVNTRLNANYGLTLKVKPFNFSVDNSKGVYIYNCTKPFIEGCYTSIKEGPLSWEEVFELRGMKMTKEEMIEERAKLVKEQGELMNRKRSIGKTAKKYNELLLECKKVIGDNGYFLDVDNCYEPGSPEQVAHANLLFYRNGVNRIYNENTEVTKKLKKVSKRISKLELELGYNG